jgi:VanZ family protein
MKTFEGAPGVKKGDKYAHFTFYFVFTVLWYFFLRSKIKSTVKTLALVFALAVALGIIIEICQDIFTKDRSADIHDVIANTNGSAAAVIMLWLGLRVFKPSALK